MAKKEYKYNETVLSRTRKYLERCGNEQMELPTVEGLALELGVHDDTLNEWAKVHEDFNEVFRRLKLAQKVQLINGGMYGGREVNAAMFIFLLKANHGMVETVRQEHTGKDGDPIQVENYTYENLTKWIIGKAKQVKNGEEEPTD